MKVRRENLKAEPGWVRLVAFPVASEPPGDSASFVQGADATRAVKDVAFPLTVRDIAGLPAQALAFGAR